MAKIEKKSGPKSASQKWAKKGVQTKFSTLFLPDSFSAPMIKKQGVIVTPLPAHEGLSVTF